ncbi:MAG TPA: lytic transglycosylase domain-containing protein [Thermodesulfobacteriota bacterium]|nr:lytic transglycosylase domain-containing protein [Thermodesulfobacteriota bacterium]
MSLRFDWKLSFTLLAGLLLIFPAAGRGEPVPWIRIDVELFYMFSHPIGKTPADSLSQAAEEIAGKHGVPPQLVKSIIRAESNGNSRAVSPKGAMGLMQLMPGTARELGVSDPFDPMANIRGGVQYLGNLLSEFSGDVTLALAAYNAGPASVRKYGGVPPYSETRNFVQKVQEGYRQEEHTPNSRMGESHREKGITEKIPAQIRIAASPRALAAFLQKSRIDQKP